MIPALRWFACASGGYSCRFASTLSPPRRSRRLVRLRLRPPSVCLSSITAILPQQCPQALFISVGSLYFYSCGLCCCCCCRCCCCCCCCCCSCVPAAGVTDIFIRHIPLLPADVTHRKPHRLQKIISLVTFFPPFRFPFDTGVLTFCWSSHGQAGQSASCGRNADPRRKIGGATRKGH